MVESVTGAILVGGKSSRMGKDKMSLKYGKKTFLERCFEAMTCFEQVVISTNAQKIDHHLFEAIKADKTMGQHVTIIVDQYPQIGPLGGIATILESIETEYVFVCACDMPFINSTIVEMMVEQIEEGYDAYILCSQENMEPLCSIYSKQCLSTIQQSIAQECYGLKRMISQLNIKQIQLEDFPNISKKLIQNMNTPEDLNGLHPPIVAISGFKNSGKTTLVCRLVTYFSNLGIEVGTIKHDGHQFALNSEGTDSYRHQQAGAKASIVFDREKLSLVKRHEVPDINNMIDMLGDVELILLEGFKQSDYPKIEIRGPHNGEESVCKPETVLAIASEAQTHMIDGKQNFKRDDIEGIASEIIRYIERRHVL